MNHHLVSVINEFGPKSAPVGDLAHDLANHLSEFQQVKVKELWVAKTYTPGGLKIGRLFNAFKLYLFIPFYFAFLKVSALKNKWQLTVVVVTTPPLLHWMCILSGRVLGVKVIVWYQDAHPYLSIRSFEKKGWRRLAACLRALDQKIMKYADSFVTLDTSMKGLLVKNHIDANLIEVADPWITFMKPSLPMRIPDHTQKLLKIIYAGNYGKAHDLSPLTEDLKTLSARQLQKFEFHFLGLNEEGKKEIAALFADVALKPQFHARLAEINDVKEFIQSFDFGIVSLRDDYFGYACPSKAFSYLSQGLPILYLGLKGTLASEIVEKGYGLYLNQSFLQNPMQMIAASPLEKVAGKYFEDPVRKSQIKISSLILGNQDSTSFREQLELVC